MAVVDLAAPLRRVIRPTAEGSQLVGLGDDGGAAPEVLIRAGAGLAVSRVRERLIGGGHHSILSDEGGWGAAVV